MSESSRQHNHTPDDDGSTADTCRGSSRERNKQRAQRRRERETSEERSQRREIERQRAALRRHNETPAERDARRLNGRVRAMRRRENETEDERLHRRELNRIRMAERRRSLRQPTTAPGSSDAGSPPPPSGEPSEHHADMQSATLSRLPHARELRFRVTPSVSDSPAAANAGLSFPRPRHPHVASSMTAFSSLNMQSDIAMLFHHSPLIPGANVFAPAALGSRMPAYAQANHHHLAFQLPSQPAVAMEQHQHPRPQDRTARPSPAQLLATYPMLSTHSAALPPQPSGGEAQTSEAAAAAPPAGANYFYYLP